MELLNMTMGLPSGELPSPHGLVLRAEVGDTLIIDDGGMAGLPRIGTITAVADQDGSPPYLVHWLAGEYESRILPGPGARIEKHREAPRRPGTDSVPR
jgi:hypothetical protein